MPVRPDNGVEDSLRLLADAGMLLSASLDTNQSLENLAYLVVPRIADWCVIDIEESETSIRRAVVVAHDPVLHRLAERTLDESTIDPAARVGTPKVIATGESIFSPSVDTERLDELVAEPVLRDAYREAGLSSLIIAPIGAKGQICGAMQLALFNGSRYTASDLLVAEDLGRRAGLAIDNARHYENSQRVAEELKVANQAKDEFLGLISHELRTPITVIHGGARILRIRGDALDPRSREELVADIEEESDRLHRVVENLLALSRAELEEHFAPEPVLLQRVATQMAEVFRRQRRQRDVIVNVDGETPPAAADQGFVEQVLRNLLSNADKYSPAAEPIEINVLVVDGTAQVEVADHGPGVPDGEVDRIFDRFYRVKDTEHAASGAGMGLAVCKRLVEAMTGQIWARQREGGGFAVAFTLPLYEEQST